jgi:hypothetical protein
VTPHDRMKATLYFAGGLIGVLGIAHSYVGERHLLKRVARRARLPRLVGRVAVTRRTLQVVWHLFTVACFGLAGVIFALAAYGGVRTQARFFSLTFVAEGVLLLAMARTRLLGWVAMCFLCAALTWIMFP